MFGLLTDKEKKETDNIQGHNTWKFDYYCESGPFKKKPKKTKNSKGEQYLILKLCLLDKDHKDKKEYLSSFVAYLVTILQKFLN